MRKQESKEVCVCFRVDFTPGSGQVWALKESLRKESLQCVSQACKLHELRLERERGPNIGVSG